jgi:hypothetical protein
LRKTGSLERSAGNAVVAAFPSRVCFLRGSTLALLFIKDPAWNGALRGQPSIFHFGLSGRGTAKGRTLLAVVSVLPLFRDAGVSAKQAFG